MAKILLVEMIKPDNDGRSLPKTQQVKTHLEGAGHTVEHAKVTTPDDVDAAKRKMLSRSEHFDAIVLAEHSALHAAQAMGENVTDVKTFITELNNIASIPVIAYDSQTTGQEAARLERLDNVTVLSYDSTRKDIANAITRAVGHTQHHGRR